MSSVSVLVPGGGGTPCNGLYGEALPEKGTFFRLAVYKRVGISGVEVYKRVGETDILVLKGSFKVSRTDAPNCLLCKYLRGYSSKQFSKCRSGGI